MAVAAAMLATACGLPSFGDVESGVPDVPTTPPPSIDDILDDADCVRFTSDDFACGGDPTGEWEVVLSCPAARSWDPLDGTCPGVEASGDGTAAGRIRISPDGTYELELSERDLDLAFSFPLACYGGATEPCNGSHFDGTCELFSDLCQCSVDISLEPLIEAGDWYRNGPNMSFRPSDTGYDLQFCRVDDHVMRLVRFSPDPSELSWGFVLRRVGDGWGSELGANPE